MSSQVSALELLKLVCKMTAAMTTDPAFDPCPLVMHAWACRPDTKRVHFMQMKAQYSIHDKCLEHA